MASALTAIRRRICCPRDRCSSGEEIRMRKWVACIAMLATLCAKSTLAATPDEVQNSIDKAEHYLYTQQRAGNWERKRGKRSVARVSDQPGGATVTAVYALLSAEERSDN